MSGTSLKIGSFDDISKGLPPPPVSPTPESPTPSPAAANNDLEVTSAIFTLKLMKAASEDRQSSFVVSPYTMQTTLGILYCGSESLTKKELIEAVFPRCNNPIGYLAKITKAAATVKSLRAATRFYVSHRLEIYPTFKDTVSNCVPNKSSVNKWKISNCDLEKGDPKMLAERIDSWMENKVGGIDTTPPCTLDPNLINAETRMLVVQAFSYNPTWTTPFLRLPGTTSEGYFYETTESKGITVDYLKKEWSFRYLENERWKVLRKETNDRNVAVYFLLPKNRSKLQTSDLADLNHAELLQLFKLCSLRNVSVVLPKFQIMQPWYDLTVLLKKLGLHDSLNNLRANFCHMGFICDLENGMAITAAAEKYAFLVDEGIGDGSQSGVEKTDDGKDSLDETPSQEDQGFTFIADHPFLFFVVTEELNDVVIVLAGRYSGW